MYRLSRNLGASTSWNPQVLSRPVIGLLYLHLLPFVEYRITPFIRTLVIWIANYPDHIGASGKFVKNATKLTCLEITRYRIKYSKVLWLIELQIRRCRKI